MAVITIKHTCDLCGRSHKPDQLAHVYGEPVIRVGFAAADRPRADICPACQARPIREVLALLAEAR